MSQKNLLLVFFVVLVILLVGIVYAVLSQNNNKSGQQPEDSSTPEAGEIKDTATPERTNYGKAVPPDFLTSLPTETGVEIVQSYSLEYPDQNQTTLSFLSKKTIEENYAVYAAFFAEQGFTLVNEHKSENLSSIYVTRENTDVNVTIASNESPGFATITISVLRKES